MKDFLHYALRPLRHFADFSGRSRRTELVAWWLAVMLIDALLTYTASPIDSPASMRAAIALPWLLLCPTLALLVRRFHDQGRTGWWAALSLPTVAFNLYADWQRMAAPQTFVADPDLPLPVMILFAVMLLALLAWLIAPDDPEANRWGPNPRYDAPLTA